MSNPSARGRCPACLELAHLAVTIWDDPSDEREVETWICQGPVNHRNVYRSDRIRLSFAAEAP